MQLARLARLALVACVVALVLFVSGDALAQSGGHESSSVVVPLSIVAIALSTLNGVYMFVMKQRMVDREKLATVERGLARLNEHIKHLPKQETLHEVSAMKSTLDSIKGELEKLSRRFERYEDHMLGKEG